MPIQKFAPMTKNFPIFDCDAHLTEPPWLWERAKDWLTKDELQALKNKDDLVTQVPAIEDGVMTLPQGPGWGADVNEEALKAHPQKFPHS